MNKISSIAILLILYFNMISCAQQRFELVEFTTPSVFNGKKPYRFSLDIQADVKAADAPPYIYQTAAEDFSCIGAYENLLAAWDTQLNPSEPIGEKAFTDFSQHYKPVAAVNYIVEKAKDHQVVIINEAHHQPLHRVFTNKLLKDLYEQGYRYLGLETLANHPASDSILNHNKYAVLNSGYYTKEPQFGNLVRDALAIGYQLFGYESLGQTSSKEREINQAKNISDFIQYHKDGKVLIHCGFSHVTEGNMGGSWEKAMAGRLTEFTGINPLSINQVLFTEHSDLKYDHPLYQRLNPTQPSVYVNSANESYNLKHEDSTKWCDIYVFHPRTQNKQTPEWLAFNDRKPVTIKTKSLDLEFPCLLFVYKDGEPIGEAIPVSVVEIQHKKAPTTLILPKGTYHIIAQDRSGTARKMRITVQ